MELQKFTAECKQNLQQLYAFLRRFYSIRPSQEQSFREIENDIRSVSCTVFGLKQQPGDLIPLDSKPFQILQKLYKYKINFQEQENSFENVDILKMLQEIQGELKDIWNLKGKWDDIIEQLIKLNRPRGK